MDDNQYERTTTRSVSNNESFTSANNANQEQCDPSPTTTTTTTRVTTIDDDDENNISTAPLHDNDNGIPPISLQDTRESSVTNPSSIQHVNDSHRLNIPNFSSNLNNNDPDVELDYKAQTQGMIGESVLSSDYAPSTTTTTGIRTTSAVATGNNSIPIQSVSAVLLSSGNPTLGELEVVSIRDVSSIQSLGGGNINNSWGTTITTRENTPWLTTQTADMPHQSVSADLLSSPGTTRENIPSSQRTPSSPRTPTQIADEMGHEPDFKDQTRSLTVLLRESNNHNISLDHDESDRELNSDNPKEVEAAAATDAELPVAIANLVPVRENTTVEEDDYPPMDNLHGIHHSTYVSELTGDDTFFSSLLPKNHSGRCMCLTIFGILFTGLVVTVTICGSGGCNGNNKETDPVVALPPTTLTASPTVSPTASPTASPTEITYFEKLSELYDAVDNYLLNYENPENSTSAMRYGYPIGTWDVSRIKSFRHVFSSTRIHDGRLGLYNFDEDLMGWDVSLATNMESMFLEAVHFTGKGLDSWNVENVIDMNAMFALTEQFTGQTIVDWTVSTVTDMRQMFYGATGFNADLSSWDVQNVRSVASMFKSATSFNTSLCAWRSSFPGFTVIVGMMSDTACMETGDPILDIGPFCEPC